MKGVPIPKILADLVGEEITSDKEEEEEPKSKSLVGSGSTTTLENPPPSPNVNPPTSSHETNDNASGLGKGSVKSEKRKYCKGSTSSSPNSHLYKTKEEKKEERLSKQYATKCTVDVSEKVAKVLENFQEILQSDGNLSWGEIQEMLSQCKSAEQGSRLESSSTSFVVFDKLSLLLWLCRAMYIQMIKITDDESSKTKEVLSNFYKEFQITLLHDNMKLVFKTPQQTQDFSDPKEYVKARVNYFHASYYCEVKTILMNVHGPKNYAQKMESINFPEEKQKRGVVEKIESTKEFENFSNSRSELESLDVTIVSYYQELIKNSISKLQETLDNSKSENYLKAVEKILSVAEEKLGYIQQYQDTHSIISKFTEMFANLILSEIKIMKKNSTRFTNEISIYHNDDHDIPDGMFVLERDLLLKSNKKTAEKIKNLSPEELIFAVFVQSDNSINRRINDKQRAIFYVLEYGECWKEYQNLAKNNNYVLIVPRESSEGMKINLSKMVAKYFKFSYIMNTGPSFSGSAGSYFMGRRKTVEFQEILKFFGNFLESYQKLDEGSHDKLGCIFINNNKSNKPTCKEITYGFKLHQCSKELALEENLLIIRSDAPDLRDDGSFNKTLHRYTHYLTGTKFLPIICFLFQPETDSSSDAFNDPSSDAVSDSNSDPDSDDVLVENEQNQEMGQDACFMSTKDQARMNKRKSKGKQPQSKKRRTLSTSSSVNAESPNEQHHDAEDSDSSELIDLNLEYETD